MAKSTTKVTKNIWQFKFFETSQAVKVGEATTTLTCKVSGAEAKPSSWTWTPVKTSVYFEVRLLCGKWEQASIRDFDSFFKTNPWIPRVTVFRLSTIKIR